jgi:chorismate mutase
MATKEQKEAIVKRVLKLKNEGKNNDEIAEIVSNEIMKTSKTSIKRYMKEYRSNNEGITVIADSNN